MKIRNKIRKVVHYLMDNKGVDIYIVSYPKCGRTWLRMILGKYLNDFYNLKLKPKFFTEIQTFNFKNSSIPKFEVKHLGFPNLKHIDDIDIDFSVIKDKKVIFLYRDPRPTSISYYYQFFYRKDANRSHSKIEDNGIDDFIKGDVGGIRSIIKYYNIWAKFIESNDNVLTVSYEDLKEDTFEASKRILNFINIPLEETMLKKSVEFNKADNLRKLEAEGLLNQSRFGGKGKQEKVRNTGKKIWYQEVKPETKDYMEKQMKDNLSNFYDYKI